MGSFTASLRAIGDVKALPATVELSDGRLSIVAGSTQIGSWSLDEIHLEEIPTGYRMAAEGDQILIELKDVESFAAELATRNKKRRFGKGTPKSARKTEKENTEPNSLVASQPTVQPAPIETQVTPPFLPDAVAASRTETKTKTKSKTKPKIDSPGVAQRGIGLIDSILARAHKRFSPYLPDWLFSRAMFFITAAVLVAMILLPGLFSVLLLIAGALLVLFGAVVYSDTVLASKWLPGRATPAQALFLGLCVLLFGVLLGVIAR